MATARRWFMCICALGILAAGIAFVLEDRSPFNHIKRGRSRRWVAAYDLGEMGVAARAAVPDLVLALSDSDDPFVRMEAAIALMKLGESIDPAIDTVVELVRVYVPRSVSVRENVISHPTFPEDWIRPESKVPIPASVCDRLSTRLQDEFSDVENPGFWDALCDELETFELVNVTQSIRSRG